MSNKTYQLYQELLFTCNGDFSPYTPAKIYAPAEECYPAEGGELENFTVMLGTIDVTDALTGNQLEYLREQFIEAWNEDQEALDEPRDDD